MNKAVFLDRDGTISVEVGYMIDINMFNLYSYSAEAVKGFNNLGYKVVVITNQAGVARGYFTIEQVEEVNNLMVEKLAKEGANVDAVYYSPYYKNGIVEYYSKEADCRKPNTGMVKKAVKKFNIDPEKSFIIGDKLTDIECGLRMGMKTVLLLTGYGINEKKMIEIKKIKPDYISENLYTAYRLIEGLNKNA